MKDPQSPYHGRIPIPPILDAQLDRLWMDKLQKIRKAVLSNLNTMIFGKKKRENWYTVFLTISVLMCNLEFIYQKQYLQTQRYESTVSNHVSGFVDVSLKSFHSLR